MLITNLNNILNLVQLLRLINVINLLSLFVMKKERELNGMIDRMKKRGRGRDSLAVEAAEEERDGRQRPTTPSYSPHVSSSSFLIIHT